MSKTTSWNFADTWEQIADVRADQTALISRSTTRSWKDLENRAARLAGGLGDLGLQPGAKVGFYLRNCPQYLEATFAAFKGRFVPANINYRYQREELIYLVDNSDSEAVFFSADLQDHVLNVLEQTPRVRAWIQVGAGPLPDDPRVIDYEDFLASSAPQPRITRSGNDLYFLYTGGTTGNPKGVMWRQDDLFQVLAKAIYPLVAGRMPEDLDGVREIAEGNADNPPIHLPASPLMHGTGAFTTFQSLLLGGQVLTLTGRSFDPDELWQQVDEHRVTQMAIVGDAFAKPMVEALSRAEENGQPYSAESLMLVISSGVMWSQEVKDELSDKTGVLCIDMLGSSEGLGFGASTSAKGSSANTASFKIGDSAVVVGEDDELIEPGSKLTGMLAVKGNIPLGYYKDPDKSDETFRTINGERYSIPGDFAQVEEDGSIILLGRGSVCINSGGEKIFPEEVEEAIKTHPLVSDCLVVGVPDDRFGQAVAAVISAPDLKDESELDLSEVLSELSRYKHPRKVVLVPKVMRAANGKPDYAWAKETAAEKVS